MKLFKTSVLDFVGTFRHQFNSNNEKIIVLPSDAPEWVQQLVRDAHDDELPNDWRFTKIYEICWWLLDCESSDSAQENAMEAADALSFVYTGQILGWYAEQPSRLNYCDQYIEEFGANATDSTALLLGAGQAYAIEKMIYKIIDGCMARCVEVELFPV